MKNYTEKEMDSFLGFWFNYDTEDFIDVYYSNIGGYTMKYNCCGVSGKNSFDKKLFLKLRNKGKLEKYDEDMEGIYGYYAENMPCDNSGFCAGLSCPNHPKCYGWI